MQAGDRGARRSTRSSCATLRADGAVRWTVSRGRVLVDSARRAGAHPRARSSTSPRPARRPSRGCRPCSGRRRSPRWPPSWPTPPGSRSCPRSCCAGAQVLGARVRRAGRSSTPSDGPLRLHMTNRLHRRDRRATSTYPVAGVEIELDDAQPTQYAAMHGRRVLLADRRGGARAVPGDARRASRSWASTRSPRCRCGWRAGVLGAFVAALDRPTHPFAADDVEVLEALAAQIALSVSRLQADARAGRGRRRDGARRTSGCSCWPRPAGSCRAPWRSTSRSASWPSSSCPTLGDWCWLVVTDEQGRLHEHGLRRTATPPGSAEVAAYVRAMVARDDRRGRARGWSPRTGRPLVMPTVDWEHVERALPDPAAREALARLGVGVRRPSSRWSRAGRPSARSGCSTGEERGPLSPAEVDTAIEIGLPGRPGAAPRPALRPAARPRRRAAAQHAHRAAGAGPLARSSSATCRPRPGAEIGGDWYDAFLQPDGATVLAIGDVVGHDTRAAAAMGQVRGLLRGIGYSSGGSPAEVLTELDRAIEGLALDTMATALVARLEQDDDDLRAGQVRLRWSSAGHPPPAVLDPRRQGAAPGRRAVRAAARAWPRRPSGAEHVDGPRRRARRCCSTPTAWSSGATATSTPAPPSWSRCCASCADLPLDELCDGCSSGCSCPTREDDVAHARRPAAPAGRAAAGRRPARRWCRRASSRRPTCIPEAGSAGLSSGPAAPPAAEPAAGAGRQVDGDRRLPAAPHRQHPQRRRPARSPRRRPAAGPGRAARRAR